jgi:hypothetical protein
MAVPLASNSTAVAPAETHCIVRALRCADEWHTAGRSEMDILFSNPKEEEEAEAAELSRIVKVFLSPRVSDELDGEVSCCCY